MQTITTKYLPATNTLGNRVKASCQAKTITVECDSDREMKENHAIAATMLKEALGWNRPMVGGSTKTGMVFVFCDDWLI